MNGGKSLLKKGHPVRHGARHCRRTSAGTAMIKFYISRPPTALTASHGRRLTATPFGSSCDALTAARFGAQSSLLKSDTAATGLLQFPR